jgi:hypothetical protein
MLLHHIIIWALRLFGCLLIYAAAFMYENEEGQWQNRLEQWREAIVRSKETALLTFTAFMGGVAKLASRSFDLLFGTKLFSMRGVGVSICYSLASVLLCLEVLSFLNPQKFGPLLIQNWGWFFFFVILGSIPSIISAEKGALSLWGLAVFAIVIFPLFKIADIVHQQFGIARTAGMFLFLALLFAVSFGCDILYIALTRWMLRKVSEQIRLPKMIGILLLNALLAVILAAGPFLLGLIEIIGAVKFNAPASVGAFGIGLMLGTALNFVDIIACSVFLLLLTFMLLHRLIWPILEMPIYACARFGIIKNKKLLWGLGAAFLFVPGNGESIWKMLQRIIFK